MKIRVYDNNNFTISYLYLIKLFVNKVIFTFLSIIHIILLL
jgi:hypothetical protein